ncbi:long-chain fatty acid--CoA ligase [Treponema sp. J25]|uniref:AMP-dependent synthetase/ligase n=1 Tax=Treponema sp. J25 TaxID=2094121 RepID=UPI00104F1DED|nr:long-chain fatty acid--CoA ligase [Treponema sp. J25]TCW61849.1 long-chain fatty acid--CoA ligase [Treponema sp. J25]
MSLQLERTLPLMFKARAEKMPQIVAQYAKDEKGVFQPKTYAEMYEEVCEIASGLLEIGVQRGDHVGLISDNRQEWLVTDFAILSLGAADVPRGCDSTDAEIAYILSFSDCKVSFAENQKQVEKILVKKEGIPLLTILITYDRVSEETIQAAKTKGVRLYHYSEIRSIGKERRKNKPGEIEAEMEKGQRDDLATIIYTSGTTGEPKGVMLSHGNFLHQLPSLPLIVDLRPGQVWLSVLPVWHSFERIMQYVAPCFNTAIAYSKPVGSIMLADFQAVRPHWMASVPRIWESVRDGIYRNIKQQGGIKKHLFDFFVAVGTAHAYMRNLTFGLLPNFHGRIRALDTLIGVIPWLLLTPFKALGNVLVFNKIKAKLGGRFQAGISGGGALPAQVDSFFSAVGILLLEGYGLTETAPVVAVRRSSKPRPGCVGQIILDTEVKVVDEEGRSLPPGHKGLIMVRGGQVMKGYYKKPEATAKVLSPDGWLNTGDLGMLTYDNEIKITGRAKDTIVLRGGENVEPAPIEEKLRESQWIAQCMVVGQDQRYLAALIVPKQDAIMAFAQENNIPIVDYETLLQQPEIYELVANDVADLVSPRNGFKPFERVFKFTLLPKPFEVGRELSHKQELMRHKVVELYAKEIAAMFES